MPVTVTTLVRLFVLIALAAWAFVMYCFARTDGDAFGATNGRMVISGLFALAMIVPLFWAATIPDLPEIVVRSRGRRRARHGLCPQCAYPFGAAEAKTCTECGAKTAMPEHYFFTLRTLVRFIVISILAALIGSTSGEAWTRADERAFADEAHAWLDGDATRPGYTRARRWPTTGAMMFWRRDIGPVGLEEYGRGEAR